jgi:4a-hydroxytetrahydrobiopterin dehydratase
MTDVTTVEWIRPAAFHAAEGLEDWRVLGEGACAYFRTGSFAAGAELVAALAGLPGTGDGCPDVDVRQDGVTVRLVSTAAEYYGLTRAHVEMARQVSGAARSLGLTADPSALRGVQVTLDALDMGAVTEFWRALLGHEYRAGSPEDLVDPRRRGAAFYFQQLDAARPQRNTVHVDVWVPHDVAEARVAAAPAAGGRPVSDADAPSLWILADPEGNEACVGAAGVPA